MFNLNIFPCRLIGKSLGFGPKEFLFESRHGNQKYFVCSDMRKRELLGDSLPRPILGEG